MGQDSVWSVALDSVLSTAILYQRKVRHRRELKSTDLISHQQLSFCLNSDREGANIGISPMDLAYRKVRRGLCEKREPFPEGLLCWPEVGRSQEQFWATRIRALLSMMSTKCQGRLAKIWVWPHFLSRVPKTRSKSVGRAIKSEFWSQRQDFVWLPPPC